MSENMVNGFVASRAVGLVIHIAPDRVLPAAVGLAQVEFTVSSLTESPGVVPQSVEFGGTDDAKGPKTSMFSVLTIFFVTVALWLPAGNINAATPTTANKT
jgi:hypothetical protein